jgi:hypothetical protein
MVLVKLIIDTDFTTCNNQVCSHIAAYYTTSWTFEDKLKFFSLAWVHPSLIVITLVTLIMFTRVLGNVNPLKSGEPLWITMLNRAIQNTLEQSFVFLGLFSYWLLNKSENSKLAVTYLAIFVIGRVIFVIGYMFFWLTGFIGFRAAGFLTTLTAQIFLISVVFGHDLTNQFSNYLGAYIKF